ncbi:MAG: helix-turn-helix transcriptional regulator [Oscillospiraceae bacterium]|nr:helix-turn-helix transcriptional regulator [Oscillospiraceae bacterium]
MGHMSFRGLVYSRFRSIAELGQAIGWSRQKTTNIVNGNSEPSLSDVDKLARALGLTFEETARFFLTTKSHICD